MTTANFKDVNENPCHMCMPMGAILPFKGIEQSAVIIHGSQGCSTYMRRHIAEHFNEPVDVASSSLNERGTIYGGEKNLKQGLDNVLKVYQPQLIGVLTTCLAETIGEDIDRIAADYLRERHLPDFPIIPVPTPGYGDSHSEGYFLAVKKIIAGLVDKKASKHQGVNVIIPNISPADIREIKRILQLMDIKYTMLPDFSDTLDQPFTKEYAKIPAGGTKLKDIAGMSGAVATIQMGLTVDDSISPGKFLEQEYGVPLFNIPLPMGIEGTDLLVETIKKVSGIKTMPKVLELERGRLLDCMVDSHKYNGEGRAVIFGEPELVYGVARLCLENGIKPVIAATGSKKVKLKELLSADQAPDEQAPQLLVGADFDTIREKSVLAKANLAIGNSDGRYLTEQAGIPLVRLGFPIHDRVGGQRLLSVGYSGTTILLDRITNTLLEHKYNHYRTAMYQKYYEN